MEVNASHELPDNARNTLFLFLILFLTSKQSCLNVKFWSSQTPRNFYVAVSSISTPFITMSEGLCLVFSDQSRAIGISSRLKLSATHDSIALSPVPRVVVGIIPLPSFLRWHGKMYRQQILVAPDHSVHLVRINRGQRCICSIERVTVNPLGEVHTPEHMNDL